MSILTTLLLNLLVSFITMLIKHWLLPGAPTAEYLEHNKGIFLQKVKPRFWLGPKRLERAEKAYDLATGNYRNLKLASPIEPGNEEAIVQSLVSGIAEQL